MKQFVIIIASLVLFIVGCNERAAAPVDVSSTLDSLAHRLDWIEYRSAQEEWAAALHESDDSVAAFNDLYLRTLSSVASKKLLSNPVRSGDEIVQRRYEYLRNKVAWASIEADLGVRFLRDSLQEVLSGRTMTIDGQPAAEATIRELMRTNRTQAQRERLFRALVGVEDPFVDAASRLIRLRNQQARRSGFNSYVRLRFNNLGISLDAYEQLLDELEEGSREAYRTLLDRLTGSLGVSALEIWDLQTLPRPAFETFEEILQVDSIEDFVSRSYRDLGFDLQQLPIYEQQVIDSTETRSARYFEVRPPFDIRIARIPSGGLSALRCTMASTGLGVYASHIRREEPLMGRTLDGPMAAGVAHFFERISLNADWFSRYAATRPDDRRMLASAFRQIALVELRLLILEQRFELEAYKNDTRDLAKLYWDLVNRILLVPRHDDLAPWAVTHHILAEPLSLMSDIVGRVIAAQTWAYLNSTTGVVGSESVKPFLVENYFRHGRRYDWRDLVERGTGENLDPSHLLAELGP